MSKVEALSSMYFPEIDKEVYALAEAESNYRKYLIDGGQLRLAAKTPIPPESHMKGITVVYGNVSIAQSNLVKASRSLMGALLKP